MNTRIVFWLFVIILFLDVLCGGFLYAMSGDWWLYVPIPISLIIGIGFTMGLSLLFLIPYMLAGFYLFIKRKSLPISYKRILGALVLLTIVLYSLGFLHSLVVRRNNAEKEQLHLGAQALVNEQFQKDVIILISPIKPVPQHHKMYEASFIVNVPMKYFGESKGSIRVKVGPEEDFYDIDTYYSYDKLLLLNLDYKKINTEPSKVVPGFNTEGDLELIVTYWINEYDRKDRTDHYVDLYLELVPDTSDRHNTSYYNVTYAKEINFD